MDAFLQQLRCRPPVTKDDLVGGLEFQLIDVQVGTVQNQFSTNIARVSHTARRSGKSGWDHSNNTVVSLFGTSTAGNSVCVFVTNFTPFFEVRLDPQWGDAQVHALLEAFQDVISSQSEMVTINHRIMTGKSLFGYLPSDTGEPRTDRWLRLMFPSIGMLKRVLKKISTRSDREDFAMDAFRRQNLPGASFSLGALEPAGHMNSLEQMFLTMADIVPSGWVRVTKETTAPHKYTTCQIERKVYMEDVGPIERSSIAPCVILSFDIECVPKHIGNMPSANRPFDKVVQIGMSLEVTNVEKIHGVICLGQTGPVDGVAILSCETELDVLNAFQRVISDPYIDPDVVTGYNIFKFDFFYMAQRTLRYEMFAEHSTDWFVDTWKTAKNAMVNFEQLSNDDKLSTLERVWPPYTRPWFRNMSKTVQIPQTLEILLESGDTEEELRACIDYFKGDGVLMSVTFNLCSRLQVERCDLQRVILESAAFGQNELFRFDMSGRCVLDLYLHCKNSMKLGRYRLNDVAERFLDDKKIDLPYEEMFRLYKTAEPEHLATVAEYCSKDCDLVLRIIQAGGIFTDVVEHSRVTYTLLTWLVTRGQSVRVFSQIGRFCEKNGVHVNHRFVKPPDTYVGATVIEPITGFWRDPIATLDFASLYPSIMQAHNLGYMSYVFDREKKEVARLERAGKIVVERIVASGIEHWFVQEETFKAILPLLLHELLTARRNVKKIMKRESDPFKKQLLNSKQLALKVSCNSVYGYTGARTGKMGLWCIAACTTKIGRGMIDDTKAAVENKYGATVVYGDSVSGYTPLLVKTGERVRITTIENIVLGDDPVYTWTEKGWTRILNVIKHELAPHKKMLRICTHSGLVHCTNDHSLVTQSGAPISPDDVVVGTELMHSYPAEFHQDNDPTTIRLCIAREFVYKGVEYDSRTHAAESNGLNYLPKGCWKDVSRNVPLSENFAKLMGMFMGDGSCGTYGSGSKIKSTWALNNKDVDLLHGYKTIGEEVFPEMTFKVLDTLESSGVYKLSAGCSQHGAVKRFVQAWRGLFYNDRREKKVPGEILNAPTYIRQAFWEGLHDADGTKDSREPEISQKGQEACAGIFYLLRSLGHHCVVDSREDKPNVFRLRARSKVRRKWTAIKKIAEIPYERYVYDLTTENHHFQAGIGDMIVHNTDSVMVKFQEAGPTMDGMRLAWKLAEEAADYVTHETFKKYPAVELEAEKVYMPYLIFDKKKRYIGRTYMSPDKPPKIDCKGVELVRRDNSQFLRDTYKDAVDAMMPLEGEPLHPNEVYAAICGAVQRKLDALVADDIPMEKFIVSKSLKKTYKNPNLPHVVLAEKIRARIRSGEMLCDPPLAGDRISYLVVQTKNSKAKLCDKTENIDYAREKKLKIDREYYVTNQLQKPLTQLVKPFGSLDATFERTTAELMRQRLKIRSLTEFYQKKTTPTVSAPKPVIVVGAPPPAKKKKIPKKAVKSKGLRGFLKKKNQ